MTLEEKIAAIIEPNAWLTPEQREERAKQSTSAGDALAWRQPPDRIRSIKKAREILEVVKSTLVSAIVNDYVVYTED